MSGPLLGFKRHLRPQVVPGEAVYLFSEEGVTALRGGQVSALVPLLDGTRDLPTLLSAAAADMPPDLAGRLIAQLDAAGVLGVRPAPAPVSRPTSPRPVLPEPAPRKTAPRNAAPRKAVPPAGDEQVLAYWDASGVDAEAAVRDTAGCPVQLVLAADLDDAPARAALQAAGLRVIDGADARPDADARLSIVLCRDYLDPGLADIDAAHRSAGRPWLLAKPDGVRVWIGPVFVPSGQPCWRCLAHPLWAHRQAEAYVQAVLGEAGPIPRPAASLPPLAATGLHLVAVEAVKWLAGDRYEGQRAVWTLDSRDLTGRHHQVRARPQCPDCGNPTLIQQRGWQRVQLRSRPVPPAGRHRTQPPQDVMDAYRHLISPLTGVVKEIRRDTRGPAFFNCFRAGPTAVADGCPTSPRPAAQGENVGTGITSLHAEVGALCEAVERASGCFHGDEPRVRGSLASLRGRALHPDDCQLFDQRQFADRERWNAEHGPLQHICDPFDEDAVLDWTPVWSLTEERHRLLPTGMLYFGAPAGPGPSCVRADSNGNAAGSTLEDAVLRGLLELVERDAVALWWYNRTIQPGVDLDAFADPWIDELCEVYAGIEREIWVLDLTADLAIPVMAAVSRRVGSPREDIVFGFGAHMDPRVAVRRALCELNQLMPALLNGTPDESPSGRADADRGNDPDAIRWWRQATMENQPYLLPRPWTAKRTLADYHHVPSVDVWLDVRRIQRRLETKGLHVLMLDQTRPDIGLPVVKVIVPGLRPFWARFAPGRLYDVPVRLGRLSHPTPYDELNPCPLFL